MNDLPKHVKERMTDFFAWTVAFTAACLVLAFVLLLAARV
jgi:hypothetical protein